jgi:predicted dehydrogenase
MPDAPRLIIWANADQQAIIRDVLRSCDLELLAIGSSTPQAAADLSKAFNVNRLNDLRQAVLHDEVDLLWLASPESVDAGICRLINENGLRTISCEPQFSSIAELGDESASHAAMDVAPLMRQSPGYRAAAQVMADFGKPQCVNMFLRGGPGHGTLYARLYDAMDLIVALCGPIESVNASLAGPLSDVPETPAGLRGHMTINLRVKSNCCACVALSDCADSWFRGVTMLGQGGGLHISDGGFEWTGPDGRMLDRTTNKKRRKSLTPGELIALQIKRLLDGADAGKSSLNLVELMALCEAARLSCLTAQDEAPVKIIEMLSRP